MTEAVKSGDWDVVSPLERARRLRGLSYRALGQQLGRTGKSAARYCQPVGSPDFSRPDEAAMISIYIWSGGEITPNDFYPLPALDGGGFSAVRVCGGAS